MIDKNKIIGLVEDELENSEYFLVEVDVNSSNVINVFVDGDSGITIHECVKISRLIEGTFDREEEDYELRVSSPGLDKPFRKLRQYHKYLNRDIKLLTQTDEKIEGKLIRFDETELDIEILEGKKLKELKVLTFPLNEIKEARPVISFK